MDACHGRGVTRNDEVDEARRLHRISRMSVSTDPRLVPDRPERSAAPTVSTRAESLRFLVPLGRALFALIFILSAFTHFSAQTIGYAASNGVPAANVLVPFAGILALVGGVSVLLGFKARWGALLLIVFLVPVTLMMHNFWAVADPMMHRMQMVMFLKNVSMLGGALVLFYYGAGPISIDERAPRVQRAEDSNDET